MKFIFWTFIFIIATSLGCSPKLNSKEFSTPVMDLRPELETEYDFAKLQQQAEQFEIQWQGQVPTAEVHEVINDLLDLSAQYENSRLKMTAGELYKKYYSQSIGARVSFFKTPYYELFQNEALPSVREAIDDTGKRLDKDLKKVFAQLRVLKDEYQWPEKATYRESMVLIAEFLDAFSALVNRMKLYKEFEVALIKEVRDEKNINIDYLAGQLKKIEGKKTLGNMLEQLESMVKEFDIPLDDASIKQIKAGHQLSEKIERINDETKAFEAIVAVWLVLDQKDRQGYFTPISSDLYKFLNDETDEDLRCLVEQTCSMFFTSLIRDLAILPKLKKFGVNNIKTALNEKTHGFVLKILEDRLLNVVLNLDARIVKKITNNMAKAKEKLAITRKNASGFTKEKFLVWLKQNLALKDDVTLGYEYLVTNVITKNKKIDFLVPTQPKAIISAKTVGASLGSNAKIFGSDILAQKQLRRAILEQMNRVMGFGGLPLGKKTTVGLIRNIQNSSEPFDVGKSIESAFSFGLLDKMTLLSPYVINETSEGIHLSAEGQIEIGQGLLATMNYLKDWQSNSFDDVLGKYKAEDIFGADSGGDDTKLFSKTDFFGIVTVQFLNWIVNLTKDYSQVGLVADTHEVVWLNEYSKNSDRPFLYAVYVDIIDGHRADEIHIKPMIKLLRLLRSVQGVVSGIEQTRFKELQKKDQSHPECRNLESSNCPSLAQVISQRIADVKQIMLPMGNTIATKFRKQRTTGKPGQGWGAIQLSSMAAIEKDPELMDQLLIIEGLVYVYEATKIESYLWAAQETYTFIQKYYNPKTNFFEMDTKVASMPVLVQMLRTFKLLSPHLNPDEASILNEKVKIWEFALGNIR